MAIFARGLGPSFIRFGGNHADQSIFKKDAQDWLHMKTPRPTNSNVITSKVKPNMNLTLSDIVFAYFTSRL